MDVVVIGCGTAGVAAAVTVRRCNKDVRLTLIEEENHLWYTRSRLPLLLSGRIPDRRGLYPHDASFYEDLGIKVVLGTKVERIDTGRKEILCKGPYGPERRSYDRLVLATGSKPIVPEIEGVSLSGVFTVKSIEGVLRMRALISEGDRVLVAGGGLAALEVSDALLGLGAKVTLVVQEKEVLSSLLDEDMGLVVRRRAEEAGVRVIRSSSLEGVYGIGKAECARVDGRILGVDYVILALGYRPNSSLAVEAGIRTGGHDGVIVDERMETSEPGIYAAGDCAEFFDRLTMVYRPLQLEVVAYRTGEVAGSNAVGCRREGWFMSNASASLFGLDLSSCGLVKAEALRSGVPVFEAFSKPSVEGERAIAKLLFEERGGTLVGAQFIGEKAALISDFAAIAIKKGVTIEELALFENSYAPTFVDLFNEIVSAAMSAKLKGFGRKQKDK